MKEISLSGWLSRTLEVESIWEESNFWRPTKHRFNWLYRTEKCSPQKNYVEFKFTTKKCDLIEKNEKNLIFLIFALKMRPTIFFRGPISRYFIIRISKVASPGAGRSFNLKSHQRRALNLCSFGIGRSSPERWASGAPPPTVIGLRHESPISDIILWKF